MDVLDNQLGYTNIIVLVLEGGEARFGEPLYAMLRQMSSIFGASWWDFMIVGVSKWSYSQAAIDSRNQTCTNYPDKCQDEQWFIREFNAQFQEKFGINKTFSFAFMDSWSQSPLGINDPVQQEHWREETDKLWRASTGRNETFQFMTIDDVLEENAKCKQENKRLHDIIDDNITELYDGLNTVNSRVDQTELDVTENKNELNQVNSRVDQTVLDVTENKNAIVVNADHISDIETESKVFLITFSQ